MFRNANPQAKPNAQIVVDQFCIQGGNWQPQPANVRLPQKGSARSRRNRSNLFVVIEAPRDGAVPPDLYQQLMATITDTYEGMTGSVTRRLRASLLKANEVLYERNLRADSAHRVLVGINCAVLREGGDDEGGEVFVGQLGPALVSMVHDGQLARYPANSLWLESESPSSLDVAREPPAGLRQDAEPNLFHVDLSPGDVLLISSTALARLASARELIEAVTHVGDGSVRDAIEALANGRDVCAVILDYPGERKGPDASSTTSVRLRRPNHPDPALEPTPPAAPPPAGSPSEALSDEQASPQELPPWLERPQQKPGQAPRDATPAPLDREPPDLAIADGDDLDESDELDEDFLREESSPAVSTAPRVRLGEITDSLAQGAQRLRESTEQALLRVLPDSVPPRPPPGSPTEERLSLSGRALVLIALITPLVMLFLVLMTRIQYDRTRRAQFDRLQSTAQSRFDAAMQVENRVLMRRGLSETMTAVEEGLAVEPDDDLLNDLRRRTTHKLDEVDVVERLYHLWKLKDLDDAPTSPIDSSRIVLQGIDIYLLNRGSDRVYKFLLNDVGDALQSVDSDATLIRKGEVHSGVQLGNLVDIAWIQAGGERTLSTFVALERAGSLLAYDPQQGIDVLPVADSDTWLKPQAIAGYFGNLYVLDPLLGHILKYVPTDNAYTTSPSRYLSPNLDVDLTGAVDMVIDGSVYVLFADGQIDKFLDGEPQTFVMQGLPSPMRSPTTIFVSGPQDPSALGYVYVADAGNNRIVQFDKNGNYLRQFRDKPGESNLSGLRGIYIDEENARMFILSGKTLWLASIPPWSVG